MTHQQIMPSPRYPFIVITSIIKWLWPHDASPWCFWPHDAFSH